MHITHRFDLKPVSANKMYYKAKQKTRDYLDYQNEIRDYVTLLDGDQFVWPFGTEPVDFTISVGLSNKLADLDNVLKPLLDTYQQMYEDFNDKSVYHIDATKTLVKKGEEFLQVDIQLYKEQ